MSSIVSAKTTVVKYQKLEIICNQGSVGKHALKREQLNVTIVIIIMASGRPVSCAVLSDASENDSVVTVF